MTEREIFDKVKTHLLKQNKKSFEDGWCLYRFGDLKCAIGCLIPDDLYEEKMEKEPITFLLVEFKKTMDKIGLKSEHTKLLGELQDIHDTIEPKYWKVILNGLEKEYFKGE